MNWSEATSLAKALLGSSVDLTDAQIESMLRTAAGAIGVLFPSPPLLRRLPLIRSLVANHDLRRGSATVPSNMRLSATSPSTATYNRTNGEVTLQGTNARLICDPILVNAGRTYTVGVVARGGEPLFQLEALVYDLDGNGNVTAARSVVLVPSQEPTSRDQLYTATISGVGTGGSSARLELMVNVVPANALIEETDFIWEDDVYSPYNHMHIEGDGNYPTWLHTGSYSGNVLEFGRSVNPVSPVPYGDLDKLRIFYDLARLSALTGGYPGQYELRFHIARVSGQSQTNWTLQTTGTGPTGNVLPETVAGGAAVSYWNWEQIPTTLTLSTGNPMSSWPEMPIYQRFYIDHFQAPVRVEFNRQHFADQHPVQIAWDDAVLVYYPDATQPDQPDASFVISSVIFEASGQARLPYDAVSPVPEQVFVNGVPARQLSSQLESLFDPGVTGNPYQVGSAADPACLVHGDQVFFQPITATRLEAALLASPDWLDPASDEIPLPPGLQPAVVPYAAWQLSLVAGDLETANAHRGAYEAILGVFSPKPTLDPSRG